MIPKRILIIQTAFIGDVILATALLESVHKTLPEAKIDFLLRKGNEGLLENHPYLNDVLIWHKKEGKFKSLRNLLKKIRREKYDWVVNLQRFGSTGFLTAFSGASVKVGFDKNPFSFAFSHTAKHQVGDGTHEIDRNLLLVRSLISVERHMPKLYPAAADFAAVEQYQLKPYICIAPSSVWFTKQFPADQWIKFINELDPKFKIYLLGAPTDQALADNISGASDFQGDIENLCGKLGFLQSAALMQNSVMNYVNDSAPMHISSAMNAPVTAVFCSTVPEFGFGPLSNQSHIVEVQEKLSCRPCGLHGYKKCPEGHFKCAYDIQTEQLLAVLN